MKLCVVPGSADAYRSCEAKCGLVLSLETGPGVAQLAAVTLQRPHRGKDAAPTVILGTRGAHLYNRLATVEDLSVRI